MRSPALLPLAWRLRSRGFAPELFTYSTLWRDPSEAIERAGDAACTRWATSPCTWWRTASAGWSRWRPSPLPGLPPRPHRLPGLADRRQRRRARPGRPRAGPALPAAAAALLLRRAGSLPAGREVGMIAGARRWAWAACSAASTARTTAPSRSGRPGCPAWPTTRDPRQPLRPDRSPPQAAELAADFLATGGFDAGQAAGAGTTPPRL